MANIRESDIFIVQRIYTSGQEEIYRATGADLVQLAQEVYTSDSGSLTVRVTDLEDKVIDLEALIQTNADAIQDNEDEITLVKEDSVLLRQEVEALNTRINSLEKEVSIKAKYNYTPGNPQSLDSGKFTTNSSNLLSINKIKFSKFDLNGLTYSYHLIQIGQTIELRWDDDSGATMTYGLFKVIENDSVSGVIGDFTVELLAGSGIPLTITSNVMFRVFPVMEPGTYLTGDELESALKPIRDDITTLDSQVVKTVNGGSGISAVRNGDAVSLTNIGIRDISAGTGIKITKNNYVATINSDFGEFSPGDKVTANSESDTKSGGFYVLNGNLYYKL